MAKSPITANQVTLLRLVLLPIGGVLMYFGPGAKWVALVFMTFLGCTDFVDGWLARRYGSTVLGRLMDPIADKVFVMVGFMPFISLKWLAAWQIGLFLSREYVITGLRSAYERRHISMRTTLLAKIKAWAQMAGCGVIFILQMVPERAMLIALGIGTLVPVLFIAVRYAIKRVFWWGAVIFGVWLAALLLPQALYGSRVTTDVLMASIIVITWLSGLSYITPVGPMILQRKFDASDWVRILGGLAVPVVLVAAMARGDLPPWAIMLTMGLELAAGGLDNLLCFHGAQSSAPVWGVRTGLVVLLTGLAVRGGEQAAPLLYAACAVSVLGTSLEFYRGRRLYLEEPVTPESITTE
jgi:CDP-diacylglycerol--glycerol-3-phosphate 3-phosphatidyltransferase